MKNSMTNQWLVLALTAIGFACSAGCRSMPGTSVTEGTLQTAGLPGRVSSAALAGTAGAAGGTADHPRTAAHLSADPDQGEALAGVSAPAAATALDPASEAEAAIARTLEAVNDAMAEGAMHSPVAVDQPDPEALQQALLEAVEELGRSEAEPRQAATQPKPFGRTQVESAPAASKSRPAGPAVSRPPDPSALEPVEAPTDWARVLREVHSNLEAVDGALNSRKDAGVAPGTAAEGER